MSTTTGYGSIALAALVGIFGASSAYGLQTNYDRGRVDFAGRVTDISCRVTLNGGNHAGNGSVWLAPVSLAEVHDRGAGAFMKPQAFSLALSDCRLDDGGHVRTVNIRWVAGYTLPNVNNENAGYLANTLADGARNIYLALATNDNDTLDKGNKIVPADPQQNLARMQEQAGGGGVFTYYVGYVTQTPQQATSGPLIGRATWELVYQ